MKKFTKMSVGVFCAVLLATSAFAADKVVKATNAPVAVETVKATTGDSLFNEGEFGVSLGTGYVIDRSAPFHGDYTFNLTAGAFWFPYRNVGVEAFVPFYQSDGVSIDEVQAGLVFRLPLSKDQAIFKNIAPYAGIGGVYNWQADRSGVVNQVKWAYIGKAGVEFRLNKKWGIFAEGQYRNDKLDNWDRGETSIQGGVKLVF